MSYHPTDHPDPADVAPCDLHAYHQRQHARAAARPVDSSHPAVRRVDCGTLSRAFIDFDVPLLAAALDVRWERLRRALSVQCG